MNNFTLKINPDAPEEEPLSELSDSWAAGHCCTKAIGAPGPDGHPFRFYQLPTGWPAPSQSRWVPCSRGSGRLSSRVTRGSAAWDAESVDTGEGAPAAARVPAPPPTSRVSPHSLAAPWRVTAA